MEEKFIISFNVTVKGDITVSKGSYNSVTLTLEEINLLSKVADSVKESSCLPTTSAQ